MRLSSKRLEEQKQPELNFGDSNFLRPGGCNEVIRGEIKWKAEECDVAARKPESFKERPTMPNALEYKVR